MTRPRGNALALRLILVAAPLMLAQGAQAQCPDGTPPPCRAATAGRRRPPGPPAVRARQFAVLPFRNLSRSPELEWLIEGAPVLLADVLGRWREISVVPEEQLAPALRRAGITPGTVPDLASLRRVADETGGWTLVTGEMIATGSGVAVRARALDALTGRVLVRAAVDAQPGEDVREAFGRVGVQLLRAAGLDTAQVDIGAATTPSLDAYRAYLRGIALRNHNQYRRAGDAFRDAVRHDSLFAQAWFELLKVRIFESPFALFDPGSELVLAMGRSVALAERLPPRRRDVIRGVGALMRGQFGASRDLLERLVASDSTNADAVGWLSFLEFVDPVAVRDAAGATHRRGSLSRAISLARRLLELEPEGHGAYIPIVYSYLLAAGDLPMVLVSFAREPSSLDQLLRSTPSTVFVPVVRDTIVPVPVDSFLRYPAESVTVARARALDTARTWVGRWVASGPAEGAAHQAAARISELAGDYDRALLQLATAESLGVEFGYLGTTWQRLGLLALSRRYAAAAALADSSWRRTLSDYVAPDDLTEARRWVFVLALMQGDFARADTMLANVAAALQRLGTGTPAPLARQFALTLLAGRAVPPIWLGGLPLAARLDALDGAWAALQRAPDARWGPVVGDLARWAAADVQRAPALEARARAAPWYPRAP